MLGLREEIHGNPVWICLAVTDHENLRGTGNHVDAHLAKDLALGLGHIGVAWAHDLVHRGNGLRAMGQCTHCLGATNGKDAVHPCEVRGRKHQGVALAAGCWNHHDDLGHPCDLRRQCIHEHR